MFQFGWNPVHIQLAYGADVFNIQANNSNDVESILYVKTTSGNYDCGLLGWDAVQLGR
jgi:hypothetical protein